METYGYSIWNFVTREHFNQELYRAKRAPFPSSAREIDRAEDLSVSICQILIRAEIKTEQRNLILTYDTYICVSFLLQLPFSYKKKTRGNLSNVIFVIRSYRLLEYKLKLDLGCEKKMRGWMAARIVPCGSARSETRTNRT